MPRDIVLGNGQLLVCLDRNLFIRDLYWPYVGLYNHLSGLPVRFGIWVDGRFAWIDDRWDRHLRYQPDTLVSECSLKNGSLGLTLQVRDAVDPERDILVRQVTVENHTDRVRHARLFWAMDTILCETPIGDTAYYDPFGDAVIHYKRDNYLLYTGMNETGQGLHDFACGMKGVTGMEGTWRDAEDGELSNNPIAQGSVDSAISVAVSVPAQGAATAYLWLTAGHTRKEVLALSGQVRAETVPQMQHRIAEAHRSWVQRAEPESRTPKTFAELPDRVERLFRQSLLIIRTQCDRRGAILAANDTDIMKTNKAHYSYLWPRDGALVAHALDSCGIHDLSRAFFEFSARILPPERAAFMQKYGPDGSVGASWHSFLTPGGRPEIPIQQDETALVVWALEYHLRRTEDNEAASHLYRSLGRPCADFLLDFRDPSTHLPLPSWDLWEERRGIHAFTVCSVIAGLRAATQLADRLSDEARAERYRTGAAETLQAMHDHLWNEHDRRFVRRLEVAADGTKTFDRTIDSSLHALQLFDVLPCDDPRLVETLRQVDERLWVKAGIGGMARYEGDYYARVSHDLWNVPGNPWILCTLWRAQWQIARAETLDDLEDATDLLRWADLCALPAGILPEQIHPYNFSPTTVAPLTWSHSEFLETVCKWVAKHQELSKGQPQAE
ncbi:MAG: glycoside hydrolase family 15 protein [Armatimonadaceae bacterium]